MMNRSSVATLLCLLLAILCLHTTTAKVFEYNAKNFDKEVLNKDTIALVGFVAGYCGHCKAMKPAFHAAAKEMVNFYKPQEEGDAQVKFVLIECPDNQQLCGRYGVQGYPTFKFFSAGKAEDYNSGRDKDAFLNFMKNKLSTVKPAPKPVELKNQKQLDACLKSTVCVYAVLPDENNSTVEERKEYVDILTSAAKKNKSYDIKWIYSLARTHKNFDKTLRLGENGFPAITLMNARKKIHAPMYRGFTVDNIVNWSGQAGQGRVSQATTLKEMPTLVKSHEEL